MLESTPIQTSDETSDQMQQDRLSKKQRLGLLSPIGRVVNEAFSLWGGDRRPDITKQALGHFCYRRRDFFIGLNLNEAPTHP